MIIYCKVVLGFPDTVMPETRYVPSRTMVVTVRTLDQDSFGSNGLSWCSTATELGKQSNNCLTSQQASASVKSLNYSTKWRDLLIEIHGWDRESTVPGYYYVATLSTPTCSATASNHLSQAI
jgi:hypothetical protein